MLVVLCMCVCVELKFVATECIRRRGSFEQNSTEYDEIPRPEAYRRVLTTWSEWVDQNVDPNRTKVFFMSMSPLHIK